MKRNPIVLAVSSYLCISGVSTSPLLGGLLNTVSNGASEVADTVTTTSDGLLDGGIAALQGVDKVLNILPKGPITNLLQVQDVIKGIENDLQDAKEVIATYAELFQAVVHQAVPASVSAALEQATVLFGNASSGVTAENVAEALLNGLSVTDLTRNVLGGYIGHINSYDNFDNPQPAQSIYPKSREDAPYCVDEASLRAAIYLPPSFEYGKGSKQAILFVPGTGAFGGVTFDSNLAKLLAATGEFDPVYLNVPGALLNDTQINAEYVAYAMNYVYAINSNRQIGVIAWSQGNLITQWAYQYWPSTRETSSDFISVSADFHGTVNAYFIAPSFPDVPNPPALFQQEYDAQFVATLRAGGGDRPYVPSTSVWSIADEIVQPQFNPVASAAYSGDSDCPGGTFTNNQIQDICPGLPAGGLYTHEGVLYNPLMYALAYDALTHDGPGQVSRLDLDTICNQLVPQGLILADILATERLLPLAVTNYLQYPARIFQEPGVMAYTSQAVSKTCPVAEVKEKRSNSEFNPSPGSVVKPLDLTIIHPNHVSVHGTAGYRSSALSNPIGGDAYDTPVDVPDLDDIDAGLRTTLKPAAQRNGKVLRHGGKVFVV